LYDFFKRILDVISTLIALLLLAPILLLIAVLIKATSPGSALFRKARVGRKGKHFQLIKFRSMVQEAPQIGLPITAKGDPRITPVGRILRRTKLDELPELWNVLIGEMSLVGPRPEDPCYMSHHQSMWKQVLSVKPGITDLATLQFRDEESVLESAIDREGAYIDVILLIKLKLAIKYIKRKSFLLDLKILILTIWGITLGHFFAKPSCELAEEAVRKIKELNIKSDYKSFQQREYV